MNILNTKQKSNAVVKSEANQFWTLRVTVKEQGNIGEMNKEDGAVVVSDNDVTVCNLCRIKMTLLDGTVIIIHAFELRIFRFIYIRTDELEVGCEL